MAMCTLTTVAIAISNSTGQSSQANRSMLEAIVIHKKPMLKAFTATGIPLPSL
jgi:hypothetical protein